jgi:hypothetical protein
VGCPLWQVDRYIVCTAVKLWSRLLRTLFHTLLSHSSLDQLNPQALGFLSVTSYDSHGLQWRYSTQLPHGKYVEEVKVILQPKVSRPVCLGIKHRLGAHGQILITVRHLCLCAYGASSLMREKVCNLLVQLLLDLAGAVHSWVQILQTCDHILLSYLRLASLFVASYDSPGYGRSILTHLHMTLGSFWVRLTYKQIAGQCLGIWHAPSVRDKIFLSDICGFCLMGCPLWREDRPEFYLYSWYWAFASAATLESKSCRTCDHILLSHLWLGFPFCCLLQLPGLQ